jgi:hypothetical protein
MFRPHTRVEHADHHAFACTLVALQPAPKQRSADELRRTVGQQGERRITVHRLDAWKSGHLRDVGLRDAHCHATEHDVESIGDSSGRDRRASVRLESVESLGEVRPVGAHGGVASVRTRRPPRSVGRRGQPLEGALVRNDRIVLKLDDDADDLRRPARARRATWRRLRGMDSNAHQRNGQSRPRSRKHAAVSDCHDPSLPSGPAP